MQGHGIRRTARLLCMALAMIVASPAAATFGQAGVPIRTCVAVVRPGDSADTMLRAGARFDCGISQRSLGSGDFWVRSVPIPVTLGHRPLLRSASLWQRQASLWAVYADGARYRVSMDAHGITQRLQLGAIVEQRLPVRAAPLVRLLWRVDGAANLRGIVIQPRLATDPESVNANLLIGTAFAAFGGMCLALLIYNLAIWAVLRHGFQLAYCGMMAAMAGYAASSSGAIAWMFPALSDTDRLRVSHVTLALAGIMALLFARMFFETRVFRGWLSRATLAAIGLLTAAMLGFLLLAPWYLSAVNTLYSLGFISAALISFPILWSAWRRGSRYLWLFAVAWAVPLALTAIRIATMLDLVPRSMLSDNSTLPAMIIEALMSSLAIAYRIRGLTHQRDEARQLELAARMLADVDPLTTLLNRRAFLRDAIGRPDEQWLILADIDHFKRVNDTIGHDGGDEVLRAVARALRAAVPPQALVARIGGEEFAILLPAAHRVEPGSILARVRESHMPYDLTVTVSIGSAQAIVADEAAWKQLYRRADKALYAAKSAGRDRARHDGLQIAA